MGIHFCQNGVIDPKILQTEIIIFIFFYSIYTIFFYIPEIVRECLQRFEQELLIPKALVVAGRLLWLLNKVDGFDFQELESKNKKLSKHLEFIKCNNLYTYI